MEKETFSTFLKEETRPYTEHLKKGTQAIVMSRQETYQLGHWRKSIMLIITTYNMVKASSWATRFLSKYIKCLSFYEKFYKFRKCNVWNVGTLPVRLQAHPE